MTNEFKVALQAIWEELPQEYINKALANFTKYLTAWLWLPVVVTPRLQASAVTFSVSKSANSSHHQRTGSFLIWLFSEPQTDDL